jgi:hypothetical protein
MTEFNETISVRHFVQLMCAEDRPSIDCLTESSQWTKFSKREWKADLVPSEYSQVHIRYTVLKSSFYEILTVFSLTEPDRIIAAELTELFGSPSVPPRVSWQSPHTAVFDKVLKGNDSCRVILYAHQEMTDVDQIRPYKIAVVRSWSSQ